MKHISKGPTPAVLRHWFQKQPIENGKRLNCSYADMPGDVKQTVTQHLLDEQGGLCCYTGQRIADQSSHIEHFKPQSLCANHEDVDYANLLAAYPPGDARRCPYGAHAKGDWYDAELLVNPIRGNCESRFQFNQFGHIRPSDITDNAAIETIQHLRLDHSLLTDRRRQAIKTALYRKNEPVSNAKLRKIIRDDSVRDAKQQFQPFCFVVQQVAAALLRKRERERIRKQAILSQLRT